MIQSVVVSGKLDQMSGHHLHWEQRETQPPTEYYHLHLVCPDSETLFEPQLSFDDRDVVGTYEYLALELWKLLVSALSVQELEDLFEIPALKEKLSEEVHLRELLKVSDEKEQSFLESATIFTPHELLLKRIK
ncbi:hypothetical protein Pelo_6178 [Pelomyxa schiedti]|nr:hypothetical protein Pelo_6178 [Pelomyxa schiedti]